MKDNKKGTLKSRVMFIMVILFIIAMITTVFSIIGANYSTMLRAKRGSIVHCAQMVSCSIDNPDDDYSMLTTADINEYLESYSDGTEQHSEAKIDNWFASGKDDEYKDIYDNLSKLQKSFEVSELFIYQAQFSDSGEIENNMRILFDVSDTNKTYDLGKNFKTTAFETVKKVYETGQPQLYENNLLGKKKDFILAAYAPIKDSNGNVVAIAGAKLNLKTFVMTLFKSSWLLIVDEALDFLLLGLAVAFFINKSVIKPVNILSKHMRDFVSDESGLEYKPINEIKTNDELEQMGDDFNALAERVVEYTKDVKETTAKTEHIKADLDTANQIRSIISGKTTYPAFPDRADFDLCLSLKNTMHNKCSFCNYFFVDTNKLFVVMGESLGNNHASIIISALASSYIKSTAKMGLEPYRVAAEVNNNLCSIEKKDSGLTIGAIVAEIDLTDGVMRYVNAGMPPLLIKNPGESFVLDKASLPFSLGQMHGVAFQQNTLNLSQGSTVLLTSYGVSETVGTNGIEYSMQQLLKNVNTVAGGVYELDGIINGVESDLDKFRGETPITKDMAILGFRYFG